MKWFNPYMLFLLITCSACSQQNKNKSPQGLLEGHYDLNKPEIFNMPKELYEISGITFYNGNPDTIYVEQDEDGKVFKFHLGNENVIKTKFGSKGDYEDIQILNDYVVMLRSDGTLYTFPLNETNAKETSNTKEFKKLLPDCEFEGLYADNKASKLYVLSKDCHEKHDKIDNVQVLAMNGNGDLTFENNLVIDVKAIAEKSGIKKIVFHPSAFAKNEATNEWFILSSVNKNIVITAADFTVKDVFDLDASTYNQPEGIAFDAANNLYISNEKGTTKSATILKIPYKK